MNALDRQSPNASACDPKCTQSSWLTNKNIKKAKGVKKNVVKKQILQEHYKETLFGKKQLTHGMNILRSDGHEIFGMNKTSLSAFDSKRWIADDGVNTNTFGYNPPQNST